MTCHATVNVKLSMISVLSAMLLLSPYARHFSHNLTIDYNMACFILLTYIITITALLSNVESCIIEFLGVLESPE